MKKKIQEPFWFLLLIILMFFVVMGIISAMILGRYDDIAGVIKGSALIVGIYELKRIWRNRKWVN